MAAGWPLIGALMLAIGFQPQNGEVLVHDHQCPVGAGCVAVRGRYFRTSAGSAAYPWIDAGLMLAMSLTGPFSIFLMPVLALKAMWFRDWTAHKRLYLPVLIGAFVQLMFMVSSGSGHRVRRRRAAGGFCRHGCPGADLRGHQHRGLPGGGSLLEHSAGGCLERRSRRLRNSTC